MTGHLFRTARAEQDLIEIWSFIAQADPAAADRLLDRLDARSRSLADHPHLGPRRDDLVPDLRMLSVGQYLILYRQVPGGAEIVRYLYGRRDLPRILSVGD